MVNAAAAPSSGPPGRCRLAAAVVCAGWIAWAAAPRDAAGVIVTGTQGNNTAAPADPALAVRWNQVGLFRPSWGSDGFLGTPIASNMFITGKHLRGSVGDTFTLSGTTYTTVAKFDDPLSDLAIWQVAGAFPSHLIMPLYTAESIAANAPLYVFGVGAARGTVVTGSAFGGGTEQKGWRWGSYDPANPVKSWGTNNVLGLATSGSAGLQIVYDFSLGVSDDEGTLAYADSGGPLLIQQAGVWSLAGVNYAVESRFNTVGTGGGFYAAVFDVGGLYGRVGSTWVYESPQAADQPAWAFSTSTTNRLAWINAVIVPEPGSGVAAIGGLVVAAMVLRRRRSA